MYDELNKINNSMGKIDKVIWDVNNIRRHENYVKYAYFDVIYLKKYLFDIYKYIKHKTPTYLENYYYINELVRFIYLERRGITNIIERAKKEIMEIKGKKEVEYDNKMVNMEFIVSNNYIKKYIKPLLTKIIYTDSSLLFDELTKLKFLKLVKLLKIFKKL